MTDAGDASSATAASRSDADTSPPDTGASTPDTDTPPDTDAPPTTAEPGLDPRRARLLAGLIVLAAAVLATVVTVRLFPFHSINHDEGVYLQQAAMLLDGRLAVRPPVAEVFRPWFFVERPDGSLYPKYAPVPAATFALGALVGSPRIALVAVTAATTLLTYGIAARLFDRRRGLLAAGLLLVSPLFVVHSGVFLPYAPTTVWNLGFVYAYLRADGVGSGDDTTTAADGWLSSRGWAAVAGICVGVAFFSRPYTAVLFAAPFVVHAVVTLRRRATRSHPDDPRLFGLHRPTLTRQSLTAAFGLVGVAVTLGYNAVVTGSPLVFPYQAFAPADGIGFGTREILGYSREYTPELAVRANARVVAALFGRWVSGGVVGTLLAAIGLVALARRVWLARHERGGDAVARGSDAVARGSDAVARDRRLHDAVARCRWHRVALAATLVSVVVGNVAFWGNLNVLGALAEPGDGLIASLGPYYHYDLVVTTAVFAADGAVRLRRGLAASRLGAVAGRRPTRVGLSVVLVVAVVAGGVVAAADPVARNANATETYRSAYEPFRPDGGERPTAAGPRAGGSAPPPFDRVGRAGLAPPRDAVVLLPTPFGDWLNHPYQPLRNDPDFDGPTVYALDERPFAVASAYPDRDLYRYVSRGPWSPQTGARVDADLVPVERHDGEAVRLRLTIGVPRDAATASLRLGTGDGEGYYTIDGVGGTSAAGDTTGSAGGADSGNGSGDAAGTERTVTLVVAADGATVGGDGTGSDEGDTGDPDDETRDYPPGEGPTATARLEGPVTAADEPTVPLDGRASIRLTVFVDYGTGAGVGYRVRLPALVEADRLRTLSPIVSVCREPLRCDDPALSVGDDPDDGVSIETDLTAGPVTARNATATNATATNATATNATTITTGPVIAAVAASE
ncbi:ArnT family glycosyltransferase [Halobaculum sp. MBLA0147]|uniref:ArnT family glycosyltransferase n=1 Tax=Halobaculum sp. MBLA0147 TaxID=3079934 RepID=UPI003526879F